MSPHITSIDCQTRGKKFVGGVSKILKSPESTTEYGLFYKKCKLDDYTVNYLKFYFENMMLCQLMCCCNASPAKSVTSKNEKKKKIREVKQFAKIVNKLKIIMMIIIKQITIKCVLKTYLMLPMGFAMIQVKEPQGYQKHALQPNSQLIKQLVKLDAVS